MIYPLDKIFACLPVGREASCWIAGFPHVSVRYYCEYRNAHDLETNLKE